MENEILDSAEKQTPDYKYAGFGIRFLAVFLDGIIITFIGYLIWGDKVVQTSGNGFNVNFEGETSFMPLAYYLIFWIILSSSPGKLVLGMKIINKDGKKLNPLQALIRAIVYIIMIFGCWFILGTKKKQALHDLAAETFVVKK
ncbi:MAG: RDD family protein [Bacteroidales bacterium]|nr:RDD family protein [Bacteroidales bacterium]